MAPSTLTDGRSVHKGGRREAAVALSDRPAAIVVEFTAPNTERHRIKLSWVAPGGTEEEAVPAEALFHDRRSEPPGGK